MPLGVDLLGFWRWYCSDFVSNATRGCLAEFIVSTAIGSDLAGCRDEWATFDCITPDGTKVEVKSSAYMQSWGQKRPSAPTFGIGKRVPWDREAGTYFGDSQRHADVYVFALLAHSDKSTLNPLNVGQWEFYVLSARLLDRLKPTGESIGLSTVRALGATPLTYAALAEGVRVAAQVL